MIKSPGTAAGRFGPAGTWAAARVAKTMLKKIDLRIREHVEIRNIDLPSIAIRESARVLSFMLFSPFFRRNTYSAFLDLRFGAVGHWQRVAHRCRATRYVKHRFRCRAFYRAGVCIGCRSKINA